MFLINHIKALSKDFDVYLVANFNEESKKILNHLNLAGYKSIAIHRSINMISDLKSIYKLYKYFKSPASPSMYT